MKMDRIHALKEEQLFIRGDNNHNWGEFPTSNMEKVIMQPHMEEWVYFPNTRHAKKVIDLHAFSRGESHAANGFFFSHILKKGNNVHKKED